MGEIINDNEEEVIETEAVGPEEETRRFTPEEIAALGLEIALHDARQAEES